MCMSFKYLIGQMLSHTEKLELYCAEKRSGPATTKSNTAAVGGLYVENNQAVW